MKPNPWLQPPLPLPNFNFNNSSHFRLNLRLQPPLLLPNFNSNCKNFNPFFNIKLTNNSNNCSVNKTLNNNFKEENFPTSFLPTCSPFSKTTTKHFTNLKTGNMRTSKCPKSPFPPPLLLSHPLIALLSQSLSPEQSRVLFTAPKSPCSLHAMTLAR